MILLKKFIIYPINSMFCKDLSPEDIAAKKRSYELLDGCTEFKKDDFYDIFNTRIQCFSVTRHDESLKNEVNDTVFRKKVIELAKADINSRTAKVLDQILKQKNTNNPLFFDDNLINKSPLKDVKTINLHDAVSERDMDTVKEIIKSNPAILNTVDDLGMTPMHLAAQNGSLDMVELLLSAEVKISLKDTNGNFPLHLATKYGHFEIVKLLLKLKSDVNQKNNDGYTPFDLALDNIHVSDAIGKKHHKDILDYFWKKFVDQDGFYIDLEGQKDNTCSNAKKYLAFLNINSEQDEPKFLFNAVKEKNLFNLRLYILAEKNLNVLDENNRTALHYAVLVEDRNIVYFLIKEKVRLNLKDTLGFTPLHLVSQKDSLIHIAEILVQAGAELDVKSTSGLSPLQIALEKSQPKMVNFFVSQGASISNLEDIKKYLSVLEINTIKSKGKFLHNAVKEKDLLKIRIFILSGENTNIRDESGKTGLHIASQMGFLEIVKLLANKESNNKLDKNGNLPLSLAVQSGFETSRALQKKRATPPKDNREELNLLENYLKITEYLVQSETNLTQILASKILDFLNEINTNQYELDRIVDKEKIYRPLNWLNAAMDGKEFLLRLFLSRGDQNVNEKHPVTKKTALHYAVMNDDLPLVKFLFSKGICTVLTDESNCDAFFYAVQCDHKDIINYFTTKFPYLHIDKKSYEDSLKRQEEKKASKTAQQASDIQGPAQKTSRTWVSSVLTFFSPSSSKASELNGGSKKLISQRKKALVEKHLSEVFCFKESDIASLKIGDVETQNILKKEYRKLFAQYHPDRARGNESLRRELNEKLDALNRVKDFVYIYYGVE